MKNKIEKAAKLIDSYLNINDFTDKVYLTYEDGSKFKFKYAFYIKLADYIIVFTEHLGYWIFHKDEVTSIRQSKFLLKHSTDNLNNISTEELYELSKHVKLNL